MKKRRFLPRLRINRTGIRFTTYGIKYNRTWAVTWTGAKAERNQK